MRVIFKGRWRDEADESEERVKAMRITEQKKLFALCDSLWQLMYSALEGFKSQFTAFFLQEFIHSPSHILSDDAVSSVREDIVMLSIVVNVLWMWNRVGRVWIWIKLTIIYEGDLSITATPVFYIIHFGQLCLFILHFSVPLYIMCLKGVLLCPFTKS